MMKTQGMVYERFAAFAAPLWLLVPLAGCSGGDRQDGEDPRACEDGQGYIEGECRVWPNTVTCGDGTVLVDGACELAFTPLACAAGTEATEGFCVPSNEACGEGTVLEDSTCRLSFTPLACGEDTIEEDGECVTAVECAAGTVRVEDAGLVQCVEAVEVELNANTYPQRIARAYCGSVARCCDFSSIWDIWDNEQIYWDYHLDYQTCVDRFAAMLVHEFGFVEARAIERDYPAGTLEIDVTVFDILLRHTSANDECNVFLDPEMLELFAGEQLNFYKADRPVGSPCHTDGGCARGAYCDGFAAEREGTCRLLEVEGEPCVSDSQCAEGLFCAREDSVCAPLAGPGEGCHDSRHCSDGLSCYRSAGEGVCAPSGEPPEHHECMDRSGCPEGYYCDQEGVRAECAPFVSLGEECDSDGECGPAAGCSRTGDESPRVCLNEVSFCELMVR